MPRDSEGIWLVARRAGRIVGTCYGELAPGKAAAMFPPALSDGEPVCTGRRLLRALEGKLIGIRAQIDFFHALATSDQCEDAEVLKAAGFEPLGTTLHMTCSTEIPTAAGLTRLDFAVFNGSPSSWARLESVFDETCTKTLDFPELNLIDYGNRSLSGYREAGVFQPELWQIAKLDGEDVGCVLVNALDEPGICQLVYCGLTPAARNRGLGTELAARARQLAATHGAKQLVVSVDQRNRSAIAAYRRAGFCLTDQQTLFVKRRTNPASD